MEFIARHNQMAAQEQASPLSELYKAMQFSGIAAQPNDKVAAGAFDLYAKREIKRVVNLFERRAAIQRWLLTLACAFAVGLMIGILL